MYSAGIISTSENSDRPYLEVLKKLDFQTQIMDLNNVESPSKGLDILIIDEVEHSDSTSGYEMILKVREVFEGYLLLLTKNKNKSTDLVYLKLGIDGIAREDTDYEVTFIQVSRLLERMKNTDSSEQKKQINHEKRESLMLNPQNVSVIKNGIEEIELTNTEYQMLAFLVNHSGSAVTYDELYQKVWRERSKVKASCQYLVTNIVFKLRIKLGKDNYEREYIRTVRTKGYMFNAAVKTIWE